MKLVFLFTFVCYLSDPMIRKPVILHINTVSSTRNGVGQIVHALVNEARTYGMQAYFFAGYGNKEDADFHAQGVIGRHINALRSRLWAEDGFLDWAGTRRLNNEVLSLKPDLVHLHNLHGYYCDLPSLKTTLQSLGVPVVMTLHDMWMATGRCAVPLCDFDAHNSDERCSHCTHRDFYPAKWIKGPSTKFRKAAFLNDITVVTPTRWLSRKTGIRGAKVIANGVDSAIFRPMPEIIRNPRQLLAVANRWNYAKGADSLLWLADILPDDWTLKVVGNGGSLPAAAQNHPRIELSGYVSDPATLARLMASSAALVNPSRQESYGLTVAEALAVNTPAIVRKGTAPEELISDPQFAVGFSHADEITKVLSSLNVSGGLKQVSTLNRMTEEYYALYRTLLNL